ncbi:MAG: S9 family peptidase [Bacteroidaceae bacterium]
MIKKSLLFLVVLLTSFSLSAQQSLTVADFTTGVFSPNRMDKLVHMRDGDSFLQMNKERTQILKQTYLAPQKKTVVFDVATVRGDKLNKIDGFILSPDESRLLIQTQTKKIYRHSFTAEYYLYSIRNNMMEPLSTGGPQQVPLFSPDGNQIAFVRENNIYLVKLMFGNSESQVTKDGKFGAVINGIPDWVNEEEFAYNRAFDFSADSKMLAYIRFDESAVASFSFMQYQGMSPAKSDYTLLPGTYSYKYPKAGMKNAQVGVYSFDIKSRVTRKMELPLLADDYVPRICFTKNKDILAIVVLNRHQNKMDLYFSNPRSRLCKMVVREESEYYIKEAAYRDLTFYDDSFVLQSERSGYNQLYLYSMDGVLKKQLTSGSYVVTDFCGFDTKSKSYYYISNERGATVRDLYEIDKKGKKKRLSVRKGTNSADFSATMKYYISSYSSLTTPPIFSICSKEGKQLVLLEDNAPLLQKVADLDLPQKSLFSFTTSDGTLLNGWMIKPSHFDIGKKYPVLFYQYSGPGSQEVLNSWYTGSGRGIGWETYMATKGYLVVCVDGRGTGGRGEAFEKCTYMSIGVKEAQDQIEAAKYIGSLAYTDASRMAIWGWSYGGYTTLMSLCSDAAVFKAGIAVAAVTDWKYYDTIYGERFMRTPKENADGYKASSVFTRADKLHGSLLLVHGTADDNVHLQNCVEFSECLVQQNKQFQMQLYTNRNHSIYGGATRTHLFTRLSQFIFNNL